MKEMVKTKTLEGLARQAAAGDKEAFIELMERCKLSLLGVARSILRNEDDVADAMQETVLNAFEKLPGLRKPAYFKTWLTRILINNCYDLLRQKQTEPLEDSLPEQGQELDLDESMDVQSVLEKVSDSDRLLLTLFYVEDLSQRQIAAVLGVTENAVKQRLARAKRHFRQKYEKGELVHE